MSNENLISIVVPVYNVENYLDACLFSIVNQTYRNIEIILVNDGSTDNSLNICNKYSLDSRVRIINKVNEGLSSARQEGIEKVTGEYFCTVDSDDYLESEFIEKMLQKIKETNSDISLCASRFYTDKESKVYWLDNIDSILVTSKKLIEENYFELLIKYYMSDSWGKLYRTNFVRNSKVKFSLPKQFNGTDLSFNHRLLLHSPKISLINEPLYNHQLLENSRVRRKNKNLQLGFQIIFDQIVKEAEEVKYSNRIYEQMSILYVKFLREAAQDIFNTTESKYQFNNEIKKFYRENKNYLTKQPGINLSSKNMPTKSLKLFCLVLKNQVLLDLYLRYRKSKLFL